MVGDPKTGGRRNKKMKRYGNLFEKAFNKESLYQAYLDARQGKRDKRPCFDFEKSLGTNLDTLHRELHEGTYRVSPYYAFEIHEPKTRIIHAPTFRDVVVQHAIYRVIYGIFDRTFISTSFACRIGYGTHRASRAVQRAMRRCSGDEYTLHIDIRKYFYSIDRIILRQLIERKIKDRRLVDVMMGFAEMESPKGIPIGNLLSQIFALIYLNIVDHFIKRTLKVPYYIRYVDDLMLVGLARDECIILRDSIERFLKERLSLVFSKVIIKKIRKGVNFCGYRTWRSCRFIRKYSVFKFKRVARAGKQDSVASILGHAKQSNSLIYLLKITKEAIDNGKNLQIPKNYRPLYDALST